MHFVYIIKSKKLPENIYVGISSDVKTRLIKHNQGVNKHTAKFKPWKLIWFCVFPTKAKAAAFENYLKTASGIALRRKRLM